MTAITITGFCQFGETHKMHNVETAEEEHALELSNRMLQIYDRGDYECSEFKFCP